MKRREFLRHAAGGLGAAALLGSAGLAVKRGLLAPPARAHRLGLTREARLAALPALPRKFAANETVTIGRTGIQTSLLAMGTGTVGSEHHSHQTALGMKGLPEMLLNGYEHGLRFFDAADSYGSHPHVAEALKHVPRDTVTVLTKTWARDAATARADIERFRSELGTEKARFARMGARATRLRRCGRRRSLRGCRCIWCGSTRSGRSWMQTRRRWLA